VAAAIAVASAGCGKNSDRSGTAVMVDSLTRLRQQALLDPRSNQFLNSERVDQLRLELHGAGPRAYELRYYLAYELLGAGQTREGITELESMMRDIGMTMDSVTPRSRQFFDLLGIAWLRLGEQENCALNPSANVCIMPLEGDARHKLEEGARNAIVIYKKILKAKPYDYGSKWLLNIAYMAVGEYPGGVPKEHLIPNLARRSRSAFPAFFNVAGNVGLAVNGQAGGLNVEDFNRDGLLDVFTTSQGIGDQARLFMADGRGGYEDRTSAAGLDGIVGGLNTIHADYDNDGFDDILVLRGAWLAEAGVYPMSLLHNKGDGTFEDVTYKAGLGSKQPRHSAAWGDFNLDGHLDLFVGNEAGVGNGGGKSRPSELYVNNGDGTFTEVAREVGIALNAFVKGVAWGDVNNDGLPDLYASVFYGPNQLFINRSGVTPDTWKFENVSAPSGTQSPNASFPTWFWDYDNDGWEDLLVLSYDIDGGALHDAVAMEYLGIPPSVLRAGIIRPLEHTRLYRNNRNGTFTDVSKAAGLADKVLYAMGSNFGDIDNDGWLDFYVGTGNPDLRSIIPNRMFRSVQGTRFEEVTLEGGFGHLQKGHAPAFVDLDRDGDQDIYMVMGGAYQGDKFSAVLFENPGWTDRHWIALELQGRAANRSAIGARVAIDIAESGGRTRTLHRTVNTGGSFGAGSLQLHVGLNTASRVKQVRIMWPDLDRSTSTFSDLAADRVYRIVQGEGGPVALDRPAIPFRQAGATDAAHRHAQP
jgi:hypothetical protein